MVLTAITVAMTLSFSTPSFRDTTSCLVAIARTRKRENPKKGTQTFLDEIESIDVALRNASMSTDRAR